LQTERSGNKREFAWKQKVPTSTYLIAIAVGQLESREIRSFFPQKNNYY